MVRLIIANTVIPGTSTRRKKWQRTKRQRVPLADRKIVAIRALCRPVAPLTALTMQVKRSKTEYTRHRLRFLNGAVINRGTVQVPYIPGAYLLKEAPVETTTYYPYGQNTIVKLARGRSRYTGHAVTISPDGCVDIVYNNHT